VLLVRRWGRVRRRREGRKQRRVLTRDFSVAGAECDLEAWTELGEHIEIDRSGTERHAVEIDRETTIAHGQRGERRLTAGRLWGLGLGQVVFDVLDLPVAADEAQAWTLDFDVTEI